MLLTVSPLMSPDCVVLLCSSVHYVVILSKQLLHTLLFWSCGPLIMLPLELIHHY